MYVSVTGGQMLSHFKGTCNFIDLYGNQQKSLLVNGLDSQIKNHIIKLSSFAENVLQL